MLRSAAFALSLALVPGFAAAGETMDCYNDETDLDSRHTSLEPEVLRVSDAEIERMLRRIREHEGRALAARDGGPSVQLSLASDAPAPD